MILFQDDADIKDDLVDDASQSGGDHNSGTDSEVQNSPGRSNSTKPKKRRNRRDM